MIFAVGSALIFGAGIGEFVGADVEPLLELEAKYLACAPMLETSMRLLVLIQEFNPSILSNRLCSRGERVYTLTVLWHTQFLNVGLNFSHPIRGAKSPDQANVTMTHDS